MWVSIFIDWLHQSITINGLLLIIIDCIDCNQSIGNHWLTTPGCVQPKFESVYLHVIKKHRNNLLFSYYCFELNSFSHCFDSVRFEKFKPEQALRRLDWKDSLFTRNSFDLTKCLKFKLLTLPDQTAFKNEQSHT